MWNEDYVVSIEHPIVKIDRYIVSNLKILKSAEYEFLFEYNTNLEKKETFDTKKMLIDTYNLGRLVEEKFTSKFRNQDINLVIEKNGTIENIFLRALFAADMVFNCSRKSIYERIQKKLNKNVKDNHYTEEERNIFDEEYKSIGHEIYKRKVEEQFTLNNISDTDVKDLIELLKMWIQTCGLSNPKIDSIQNQQNLFSIILLSHKVYLFINNKGKSHLEVKITHSMSEDYKSILYVDTIEDLIYFQAMNYFISGRDGYWNYIICSECGKMVAGAKTRKTCSDTCRKRKSRKR